RWVRPERTGGRARLLKWGAAMLRPYTAGLLGECSWAGEHARRSDAENHHFGGFDERGGAFAGLQTHFFGGIRGDDRGDVLLTDSQGNLCQESAEFDGHNAPDKLVAPADFAKIAAPRGDIPAFQLLGNQPVNLRFRDAMVPAGRFGSLDFAVIDPLLQRGIADAEYIGGFTRRQESLHGCLRFVMIDGFSCYSNTFLYGF